MVSIEQLKVGLANYLDNELIPTICANENEKILAGVVAGIALKRLDKIVLKYTENPAVKMMGLVDEKGTIDADAIFDELSEQMKGNGVSFNVPVFGKMTFTKEDVVSVKKYIEP